MCARLMSRSAAVVAGGVVWLSLFAGGAFASSVFLCVPSSASQAVVSGGPSPGTCSTGTKVALPASSADQQTLLSILPHISFSASGIGGKPTIQLSGVNVQIIDGSGHTSTVNGTGNLVLGYDESPGTQSGSHDLILGEKQTYSSYGDILGGVDNRATGSYDVVAGDTNTVHRQRVERAGRLREYRERPDLESARRLLEPRRHRQHFGGQPVHGHDRAP